MKKKIISAIALVSAVILTLGCATGCGKKGKTVDDIKKAGELVIATSPDFPPFEELKSNGAVEGIEIDIMNIICEKLGVTLKIKQMDFDSVLPGAQAGKYDVGVSGISVTEKRQKNTLFTDPYCLAAQAIVVTDGSSIKSKADLTGKTIAVQTGTTAETYCMEQGYTVNSYAANNDAESALTSGKVDAWVIDDLTAADMVAVYNADNSDSPLVILDEAMTTEPYAFAFAFGSEALVEEINGIIDGLVADGTIAQIFKDNNAPFTSPETK